MSAQALRPLVIKIGSSTLTDNASKLDREFLSSIAAQVSSVRAQGFNPVVVTSAAIACGLETLGIASRPTDMPSLQAAASVGQGVLLSAYAEAFAPFDMISSAVLLTRRDTADRSAYLHARDTLLRLLEFDVVPIVNENDTVSVEQIRFGDNDTLAALVACLIDARLMVILSDIDGLYDENPRLFPQARLLRRVERIDQDIVDGAGDAGSAVGSGGMATKVKAARVLMAAGIPLIVCNGHLENAVVRAAAGEEVGTLFAPIRKPHEITPKKLWIALGDAARGSIVVDAGAKSALVQHGASLLSVGTASVQGRFASGDIVDVRDEAGYLFARGKVAFSSDEVELACGRSREELESNRLLAPLAEKPLIHRDELIVFE